MIASGPKTILLVEDEASTVLIVTRQLKRFGYDVITVNTGEAAVDIACCDESVDLILMDILLGGGLDGAEAAKQILARREVPVIFLSYHSDRETVNKVRGISRYGYVLKNADEFVLQSSIEMAFELFDARCQLLHEVRERKRIEVLNQQRIEILTQPVLTGKAVTLEDLFTRDEIQRIQDEFSVVAGIASLITHPDGTPYTAPSTFTYLCSEIIRKTTQGCANCFKSDAAIGRQNPDGPIVQQCLSGGLWDAGASITVGGRHVANWLIGQVRNEAQTEEGMRAYARTIGADEEEFIRAFNDVPMMSRERFEQIAKALFTFANQLSTIAFQNIQQSRYIQECTQSEDALRKSEARFRAMFEQAAVGVAQVDIITGRFAKINKKFCDLLGYTEEEMKQIDFMMITHPDSLEADREKMSRIRSGEVRELTWEKQYICKNRQLVWVNISVSALWIPGATPDYTVTIVQDISERKQIEQALKDGEERYRTLVSNADLVTFVTDNKGVFTLSEGRGLSRIGLRPGEVVGLSVFDIYRDFPTIIGAMKRALAGESPRIEVTVQGIVFDIYFSSVFDNHGNVVKVIGVSSDITERKHSEQRLAEERERLSVTLRSIGDGVITTDIEGKIVMLNKVAEVMTEWNTEEAAGCPLQEVFAILDELTKEPCENPVETVLRTGTIREVVKHPLLKSKHGKEILIAYSGAPIRDAESRITGVVLVFRDMTERQKLNDSMQQMQKLESIGILAGGIAHDFNNLLGGMFGYLEMALVSVEAKKTERTANYLNKALSVFKRAKGLTQQLLTFSKGGIPIRKTIDIAPLIRHSATFALSGSNVKCQLNLADDLWLCDCDENQIGQVLDNIVINGRQAMPMGGNICITAVNVLDQPCHPGKYVRIDITDQGVGIPKEMLTKIFDPFFTTKATGHGLGLATVYSILQRHDGWVDVESNPGKGTTFQIFIPASQQTELESHIQPDTNHRGSGTILIMDDEEFMRDIVADMLQEMGYAAVQASDAQEAVTLFTAAEHAGRSFTASILDMTIPGGIGGKEVATIMRSMNPNAICIASSGYSEDPVIAHPADYGFTDRIIKPYRRKELTELMVRILP